MRGLIAVALTGCGFSIDATPGMNAAADAAIDGGSDGAAPGVEWIVEAEDFTSRTSPQAHMWTPVMTVPGYSGASYMELLGGSGSPCAQTAVLTCGAAMTYVGTIAIAGTYHLHLRMRASNGSHDSVFVSVDDPTAVATTVTDVMEDGTWRWTKNAQTYALAPGPHTIHVWHREGGAVVDKLAFLTSSMPPP